MVRQGLIFLLMTGSLQAINYQAIGQQVWLNESGGRSEYLIFWNQKEEFPSLGIGHFIWYPENYNGPFEQGFKHFISFCKQRNCALPAWLASAHYAPWPSRDIFINDQHSSRMKELRAFLEQTFDVQAQFLVHRMRESLEKINALCSTSEYAPIKRWLAIMQADAQGLYVLTDYVNFKGDGMQEKERYDGHGWGLLQVLQTMKPASEKLSDLLSAFADAAQKVLKRRIAHAPPARKEERFLAGWVKRINTYSGTVIS